MLIKDFIKEQNGVYILEKVLNKDKVWIYLNDNLEVPKEAVEILQKVKNGYPIEYIFEEVWFYGDKFYIKEGVLIPRDDTEAVVQRAIKLVKRYENPLVVDCCTGSGVIAVEIAKHTNAKILATDISDVAVEIAKKNIILNKMENKVKVVKGDLFSINGNESDKVSEIDLLINDIENFGFKIKNGFIKSDILISNPPYVENSWKKPNEFEPDIAFFGGEDGLDIIKKLINTAVGLNYKAAVIEIGYNQKEKLEEYLKLNNIKKYEFFKDLCGNIRGVELIISP